MASKTPRSDLQEIARALGALHPAGDVIEMRVPKTEREGTVSGYFDNQAELAKQLAARNGDASVYTTMNPVVPSLLARCANRIKPRARTTTSDKDILRRRFILGDCDPVRPADISSTDAEHALGLECARTIRFELSEEGLPQPILADSGNGAHLLWLVDLPNDDASTELVKAFLKAVAARFNDAAVKVDETVYNAARIIKAYGTVACKGDSTSTRPHRLSRLLDVPNVLLPVPRALLEEIAAAAPKPTTGRNTGARTGAFNLESFLARNLQAREPVVHEGGRMWVLESCPFNAEHVAPDAAVFERADGSFAFKCFHNSCAGKHWADVRALYDGPRRDRPAAPAFPPPEGEDAPPREQAARSGAGRPEPPKVLTYCELKGVKTPMQRVLFDGYPLAAHGATLLFGQSKAGKTVLAVQQALAVARGKHLFDYYTLNQPGTGAVLIVEQDDPGGAAGIRDLVEHSGAGPPDMPFFLVPKLPFGFGLALLDWLEKQITARKLVMVVLDSYTALRGPRPPGMDIVKAEQFELAQLDELGKRLECCIVIIHHDSTGKAARGLEWCQGAAGTFAMSMATEGQIHVARFADLDIKAPERLVRARARHAADTHLVLRFREKTEDYEFVLESSAAALYPLMKQIKAEFGKEAFGIKELSQATGASRATAFRQIDRLLSAGVIQKPGRGEYVFAGGI